MAELGYDVLGVEIDDAQACGARRRVELPFYEPGLADLLARNVASGRLRFTDSFEEAGGLRRPALPLRRHPAVRATAWVPTSARSTPPSSRSPRTSRRPALVVGKSTVPVGTAARLAGGWPSWRPPGADAELAWNPEFLREGFAVKDTLEPDRLVFGVTSEHAREGAARLLRPGDRERQPRRGHRLRHRRAGQGRRQRVPGHQDLLHQRRRRGVRGRPARTSSTWPTRSGHDARIGRKFLNAGIGFGGGCLPKDIRAFLAPRRRARRRRRDGLPARGRRHQPAPPCPRRRDRPVDAPRGHRREAGGHLGRGVQARQRRRARLPGPVDRRRSSTCGARTSPSTTRRRRTPPAGCSPRWSTPTRPWHAAAGRRPGAAPDRVAGVPRARHRRRDRGRCAARSSWTAATCWTSPPGGRRAGPSGAWDVADSRPTPRRDGGQSASSSRLGTKPSQRARSRRGSRKKSMSACPGVPGVAATEQVAQALGAVDRAPGRQQVGQQRGVDEPAHRRGSCRARAAAPAPASSCRRRRSGPPPPTASLRRTVTSSGSR